MTIGELFSGVRLKRPLAPSLAPVPVDGLDYDSRRIAKDFLFFAFTGSRTDGRRFVQDALSRGAVAVASESEAPEDLVSRWLQVCLLYTSRCV